LFSENGSSHEEKPQSNRESSESHWRNYSRDSPPVNNDEAAGNPKEIHPLWREIRYKSKHKKTVSRKQRIGCPRITRINANGLNPLGRFNSAIRVYSHDSRANLFSSFVYIRVHSWLGQVLT
jgi:hypothetical protein